MNQSNNYFAPSIRNSYGYQDQSNFRPNIPPKAYQPFNTSFQDSKISNPIKAMETRVDGVEAILKHKKSFNYQQQAKTTLPVTTNNNSNFQPNKFAPSFNHSNNSQNTFDQKPNQLRGSCPNIFKKFDQSSNNLRSTTQFVNLTKYGFNNDNTKKQPIAQSPQNNSNRLMKKTQNPILNEENIQTNEAFNPNKSLSSGQLPSFRYNLNKSQIKKQFPQISTHSPIKFQLHKTPTKTPKHFTNDFSKKSPQISVKTSANSTSQNQTQQKKFKSLHQIWQIKQKQKTQKKITQDLKNNTVQKSKVINGFEMGKILGKGKFGEVFLARQMFFYFRHQDTGFVAAIKKIVKSKVKEYKMTDQFIQQIKLHSALDHPNIVKFFGCFEDQDDIYLVLQYMNGGTLFDYLNQVYRLGVKETIEFLRDIIESIAYLHEKSIAHRDIKPENIVISTEGVAKLCDFGWSAVVQTSRKTYCGTFDYAPPQILERKTYDMSVDVWCIGVLTYELLTGRVPFEGQKRNQIMEKIVNVDKYKIQYPLQIPKQAKDFIELLIQKDPSLRPKPLEMLKHPFFNLCPPKVKSKKLQ